MNRWKNVTPLLQHFIDKGPPGCACTVVQRGKTLYEQFLGYADVDNRMKIAPETVYRIYSMTKVVTCTAALMLFERGLFLLDDPLDEYLPEFKNPQVYRSFENDSAALSPAAGPIRIKHLFSMSSGLTYGGDHSENERRTKSIMNEAHESLDLRSLSKALAEVPLAFDPGTRWKYGTSHDVLAALIEVLSGQSFGSFLKQEIFEPLGMKDTSFALSEDTKDRLCKMYDRAEDGKMTLNTWMDKPYQPGFRYESGGAGLLSTIADYSRFAQMLANGGEWEATRILSPYTIKLMSTNQLNLQQMQDFSRGQHSGYGYGLGVRMMMDPAAGGSNSSIGEFGWAGMAGSWVLIDPIKQMSIVYMQQMLPSMEPYIHNRLRSVIYGALQ